MTGLVIDSFAGGGGATDTLSAAQELVARGILSVDPRGRVWRLARYDAHGNRKRIEPKRAETFSTQYATVRFTLDGKPYLLNAHRLVWTVLNGPIPEGAQINHKDGCKHNNAPENLELVTAGGNLLHAYRTGLMAPPSTIPEKVIHRIADRARELRARGLSYRKIGLELGVCTMTAWNAVHYKSTDQAPE